MAAAQRPLGSMTGYGRGAAESTSVGVEVELRSVNHKGFHLKLRLPSERMESEAKFEARIRKVLQRGSVQGFIRLRTFRRRTSEVDHEVLRRYLKEWRGLENELGLEKNDPSLGELLAMPGALETAPESERDRKAIERTMLEAFDAALEGLVNSRVKEGAALRKELQGMVKKIKTAVAKVERRLPIIQRQAEKKLQLKVQETQERLGVPVSTDLAKEFAVWADRADVREEIARLDVHLVRLDELLKKGGPCGRELEFVLQAVHREITTLGNKSADATLSDQVVAMKLVAAQFKEQVANVE